MRQAPTRGTPTGSPSLRTRTQSHLLASPQAQLNEQTAGKPSLALAKHVRSKDTRNKGCREPSPWSDFWREEGWGHLEGTPAVPGQGRDPEPPNVLWAPLDPGGDAQREAHHSEVGPTSAEDGDNGQGSQGAPRASPPAPPADLIEQRVQHADAKDASGSKRQSEHKGQVGAVLPLPLQERGAQMGQCPQP